MPIMSLKQFKKDTAKWFSLRNGAIGAIDSKLEAYHKGSPNQAKLLELSRAVDNFINEKNQKFAPQGGDYHSSKREGKGAITLLHQQVQAELAANNPARPVVPMRQMGIAAEAKARALARRDNAEANHIDVTVPVSQELDYRDGKGVKNFSWDVRLRLIERPTELAVRVAVKLAESSAIAGDYKARWKRQIASSWNGAVLTIPGTGGAKARTLSVNFELEWKASSHTGPAYLVNVHQPPPRPAEAEYHRVGTGQWQATERRVLVGNEVGTPNMAHWGADDEAAIVHEFGHMLGCPDEYYTVSYNGMPVNPGIYDQTPFTTDSIMNNTGPKGRILPRHYALIREQYELWQGLSPGSTRITLPG
jgi:hypothetical protein